MPKKSSRVNPCSGRADGYERDKVGVVAVAFSAFNPRRSKEYPILDQESKPSWMSEEELKETRMQVEGIRFSSSVQNNSVTVLRGFNRKKQLEQDMWIMVYEMFVLNLQEPSDKQRIEIERIKGDLFSKLESTPISRGPVGDFPMHACFLLHLEEIGQEIVDKFYSDKDGEIHINTPYSSDLTVWEKLGVLQKDDPYDDGGLYTGETILHLSIVQVRTSDRPRPEFLQHLMLLARNHALELGSKVYHILWIGHR